MIDSVIVLDSFKLLTMSAMEANHSAILCC